VLKLDEVENFLDTWGDFVLAETVFGETVGDVVADSERIKESAFLKHKPDLAAEGKEVMLAHGGDAIPQDFDLASVRAKETGGHFESESFAGAGFAKEDKSFARLSGKGDAAENIGIAETDVHIGKLDGGLT
jgi:hypothetical protein